MSPKSKQEQNNSLREDIQRIAKSEKDAGAYMFLKFPDRWYDNPHWRCINKHVSTTYLKSEARGGDLCLECGEFVNLTFPEDKDGHLFFPKLEESLCWICKEPSGYIVDKDNIQPSHPECRDKKDEL